MIGLAGLRSLWYHHATTLPLGDGMAQTVNVSLRLPPKLHAEASKLAKEEVRSLNALVIVALLEYVARHGDTPRRRA